MRSMTAERTRRSIACGGWVAAALVVLAGSSTAPALEGGDAKGERNLAGEGTLPQGPGLAQAYPGDRRIGEHPAVIFADGFEREDGDGGVKGAWDEEGNKDGDVLALVAPPGADEAAHLGERCLQVTARLGRNNGGGLTKWFEPSDRVFIRFYTRFAEDCDYVHHFCTLRANRGLRGGDRWSGFGGAGVRPEGGERFSTALEPWGNWGRNPPPGRWNFYSYWHEMTASPDGKFWGNSFQPAGLPNIPRGRWTACEFMLGHNTPGDPDGEQAFWIDGRLLGHWKGINWRRDPVLRANAFTLESYVTDRWTKNETNVVFFDNVVIAREYIGPAAVPGEDEATQAAVPDRDVRDADRLAAAAEPGGGQARGSGDDAELRFWLENMVLHHGYSDEEVGSVTGLDADAVGGALERVGIDRTASGVAPRDGDRIRVLPYPGGRHPRIGFLDGAVDPQRETKASVFAPWDGGGYVVMDLPEAIWSNLGLTYLAHTHVDTIWTARGIRLEPLEWHRAGEGRLELVRELPNGIRFGTSITPKVDDVAMEIWLENGTAEPLSDLRVQMCVMLKGAPGFTAQTNDNKTFRSPFVACRSDDGRRWVITAWQHCQRAWGNPPCPCLHSDPRLPDCPPGGRTGAKGWIAFHEGAGIERELERLAERWGLTFADAESE